jgi:hypothetical protein
VYKKSLSIDSNPEVFTYVFVTWFAALKVLEYSDLNLFENSDPKSFPIGLRSPKALEIAVNAI